MTGNSSIYVSPVKTKTRILLYISRASFFALETRAVLEAGVAALLNIWGGVGQLVHIRCRG